MGTGLVVDDPASPRIVNECPVQAKVLYQAVGGARDRQFRIGLCTIRQNPASRFVVEYRLERMHHAIGGLQKLFGFDPEQLQFGPVPAPGCADAFPIPMLDPVPGNVMQPFVNHHPDLQCRLPCPLKMGAARAIRLRARCVFPQTNRADQPSEPGFRHLVFRRGGVTSRLSPCKVGRDLGPQKGQQAIRRRFALSGR